MRKRFIQLAATALALGLLMLAPLALATRPTSAQEATPVPGAQTWHVLVNNVSPEGKNWSFNAFYPDSLQAHPGDTIVFTLAPNPQAFHTVQILTAWRLARTPLEYYQGYLNGFRQPDLNRPGGWQSTYFGVIDRRSPCGRVGQDPCVMPFFPEGAFGIGVNSGVLVNPPPGGGEGNRSFTVTLDPALLPGPYYMMSNVDGPTMSGLIEVVPPDQPVQSQDVWTPPPSCSTRPTSWRSRPSIGSAVPPSRRTRTAPRHGRSRLVSAAENAPGLSINAFARAQMVIIAGDTVTWTNQGLARWPTR